MSKTVVDLETIGEVHMEMQKNKVLNMFKKGMKSKFLLSQTGVRELT